MRKPDPAGSMLWGFLALMLPAGAIFLFLFWLLQPTKHVNPGMAAYKPPSATRVEPVPPKLEAPQITDLLEHNFSAFARHVETPEAAEPVPAPKHEARGPVRPKPAVRRDDSNFAQQWGGQQWGGQQWGGQQWGGRQRQRGNSWFW